MGTNRLRAEKHNALKSEYSRLCSQSRINKRYLRRSTIVDILYESPAPRFYISPRTAEAIVCSYYRGALGRMSEESVRMAEDLVENYERLVLRKSRSYMYSIWNTLVECPAKSFYISKATICNVIFNYYDETRRTQTRRNPQET